MFYSLQTNKRSNNGISNFLNTRLAGITLGYSTAFAEIVKF